MVKVNIIKYNVIKIIRIYEIYIHIYEVYTVNNCVLLHLKYNKYLLFKCMYIVSNCVILDL